MRKVIWSVAALSLVLAGPSMAAAKGKKTAATDEQLTHRIERRIANSPSLKSEHVNVSVKDHVATLTGSVDTRTDKMRAERLARINGVRRIDDRIDVNTRATSGTFGEQTKHGGETVTDRTKHGAESATDKVKEGVSKTGEVITDGWITGRVKTRFVGDDALKNSHIDVDTSDHVVTLNGTVTSAAGRARAVELAKGVEGVHRVVDRLAIGAK